MQGLGCISPMSTYGLICTGRGGDRTITPLLEVSPSGGVLLAIFALYWITRILNNLVKQPLSFAALLVTIFPSREKAIQGIFHQQPEPQHDDSTELKKPSAAPPKEPRKLS